MQKTPQTFYYHFHDKNDLAAWVFLHDFAYIVDDAEPEYSPERNTEINKHMEFRSFFGEIMHIYVIDVIQISNKK